MNQTNQLMKWGSLFFITLFFMACTSDNTPQKIDYNPEFDAYLSAFTDGEISKKGTVLIRFATEVAKKQQKQAPASLISFSPAASGELIWKDSRTLEFLPKADLKSGQIYTAKVDMKQLFADIPSRLATFPFQFKVKDQHVNVSPLAATAHQSADRKWMQLQGKLETNDLEDAKSIEKILQVFNGAKEMKINWQHKNGHEHIFTIDSVQRGTNPYALTVTWNGEEIDANASDGTLTLDVPSSSTFKYNKSFQYNSPEQHIVLEFTDLLDPHQDLEGLVTLASRDVRYSIDKNLIKIYPEQKLLGDITLAINKNIKSLEGKTLNSPSTETITFSDAEPAVEIVGRGNIIPRSTKMPIVFKSINLNAVDVRVIKIKEDNIQQFFQVNHIDGNTELKRVGQEVMQKRIALDKTKGLNLADWTHHSLDLSELLEPEPGAIYEIAIGFRPSYSLYQCAPDEEATADNEEEMNMLQLPEHWDKPNYESSYWDWYGNGYNYQDRNNPCKPSYYNGNRVAKRNILASDLGIMAKSGDNGNLYVVNNLQTTEPMSGVTLEFYDYHQDLITSTKTGKDGMVEVELEKQPFLLIAKSGKQRGYLRLDDGSALSMSRFDVAGNTYVKGLKGLIYGERGVWRPGDELFLNFILEDKDKTLPSDHPVQFELRDPRGAVVVRRTRTDGVNGMYNFTCATDETAPTGNYSAVVRVGGATFSKTIKIETIKPNRLKMAWDFGAETLDASDDGNKATLTSKWLHGAKAKNLKAKVELSLKDGKTEFKKFPDYTFEDPATTVDGQNRVIYDGKLDADGVAQVPIKLPKKIYAPGKLNAVFRTQVFEPGGDFSIDQVAVPLHPFSTYVGVRLPAGDSKRNMLLTDQKHRVELATVDKNGSTVANKKLEVKLYKLSWRWWFDKRKNEVSSYRGRVNATEVEKTTVTTGSNGVGVYEMEVKYPEWGRYLVRACDGDGHCTGEVFYIDWPGWAGKSREGDPTGATALNFSANKEKYTVGEEVTLNIPTGFAGRALVTIENGSKILEANWIDAKKGSTQYTFKTTSAMAPNVYAYVTLLQPHAQTKNDLPIRMYGVLPIAVEDPSTHLAPSLAMADELKPNEKFSVKVGESNGKAMNYTIAIVDEGLLDLTRFPTPSPWSNFYKKEALGVKTWDMYNSVLGAFGGDIKSLLSIGGDGALLSKKKKKSDRFKPCVIYAGPFHLKAGETKTHSFDMPNYVGSVRAMVVAAEDGAYGSTEKAVPVRQPLMVLGSLPRVLGPGETIKLPVTVFAMKEGIKDVQVSVQGNDLIEVVGGSSRSVKFKEMGEEMTYFEMKVKDRAGLGNVNIKVSSGSYSAEYDTPIEVRLANPEVTEVFAQSLEKGASWKQAYKPGGVFGTNNAVLEVSSIPPLNLGKRLRYLIRYPYGCVEQTTSSVFPQVYLSALMELPKDLKEKTEENVKAGVKRLQRFQHASGGMTYWPGASDANAWATNYAGHFLLEAEKAGYTIPKDFKNKWLNYQKQSAKTWSASDKAEEQLTQAYRLYLLALAGKAELGAMNRFRQLKTNKDAVAAQWHLAAAYHLAGQKSVAKKVADKATFTVAKYSLGFGASTFGSQLRDQALILQTMSIMDERSKADELVKTISNAMASQQWLSTQETSQSLVAMAKFVGEGGVNNEVAFEYRLNNGDWKSVKSTKPIWQMNIAPETAATVEVRNKMGQIIFARLISEGIPKSGDESDASNGMAISIDYLDLNGKAMEVANIEQGTEFYAAVTVRNSGTYGYNELALHHVLPSGWEVINHRLLGIKLKGDTPEYQDIRDDRVYSFFDLPKAKAQTYYIRLNATYLGRYYLPAVAVHAMYDKSLNARKKGQWVEVIAQSDK